MNVANEAQTTTAVEAGVRVCGRIDVVVNNAGYSLQRNTHQATVDWRFTTADARIKLLSSREPSDVRMAQASVRSTRRLYIHKGDSYGTRKF